MPTQPKPEQLQNLIEKAPKEGPLYMLNLLKFKEKAEYPDGRESDLTGAQVYGLYGVGVGKILEKIGAKPVFGGATNVMLIGDGELEWDMVAIVEYPTFESFTNMTSSDEYQAIHIHREAGLAHQLLINCLSQQQISALMGKA